MTFKLSGRVFFKLPFGNPANPAYTFEPLVSQPPGGAAVTGIVYHEGFVAVGGNPGLVSEFFDCFDTMQNTFSRRPQFYLIDQPKKLDAFSIVSFGGFFGFFLGGHG